MAEQYIFQITPYDTDALLPQVSKALEKRTEMASRLQYPGMWQRIDRINRRGQGRQRSRCRTKLLSIVYLAAGIFLLIPGITNPRELLLPLLAGAIAVIYGVMGLWRGGKNRKNPFEQSAKLLLDGRNADLRGESAQVIFSDSGMTLPVDCGGSETVPYGAFECAVETADTFLFVYGECVVLLQKKDLTAGGLSGFSKMISGKIGTYQLA